MTLEHDIDVLKRVPFFADLPAEPLKLLAFSAETRALKSGATLFTEGETAEGGFVVMAGRIDLVRPGRAGPVTVAEAGPGILIGELALIIETIRPATAVAVGDTKVVSVRRQTFRRVLEEYPLVAARLHDRFAQRLGALEPDIAAVAAMMGRIDKPR